MTHGLLHPPAPSVPGKKWDHCRLCDVILKNSDKPMHEVSEPHASLLVKYKWERRIRAIIPADCPGPVFPVVYRAWEARMLGLL